ncbi:GNAT family N-acetyltransferase [Lentilactobacillus sp. Marseille-Q4993]|uniref:GNAT family N-acetyltransferase n=1 Tax=Lentilactobacillus sp. Marseille-Q4993 TaxID=3039492 RepID=UPI0032DF61AE
MNDIEINFQKLSDLGVIELYNIYRLRVDVFVVEQNCAYPEVDDEDLTAYHLSMYEGEHLVAYCRVIPNDNQTIARIGRVIVAKEYRRRHLGSDLINEAMDRAKVAMPNLTKFVLAGQVYVKDFYHSFGFKDVSDEYLEDGIPNIDMELDLKN